MLQRVTSSLAAQPGLLELATSGRMVSAIDRSCMPCLTGTTPEALSLGRTGYRGWKTYPCVASATKQAPGQRLICLFTLCSSSVRGALYYTMSPKLGILLVKAEYLSSWGYVYLISCEKLQKSLQIAVVQAKSQISRT